MNAMTQHPLANEPVPIQPLATYDARNLVAGAAQARILLDGQIYFLRITRAGKLILTK